MDNISKPIKVGAILCDHQNQIILQLRDESPGKDQWVLFGGSVEGTETSKEAILRELMEELEYAPKNSEHVRFWKTFEDERVISPIFHIDEPIDMTTLVLHEGSAMRAFDSEEIKQIPIGFNQREIIEEWFNKKHTSPIARKISNDY